MRLADPVAVGDRLWWLEARPEDEGRQVVVCRHPDGRINERTPAPFSARTRVHEYGGGSWLAMSDGTVYFTNFADQRLWRLRPDATEPEPITPEPEVPAGDRYADLVATADGRWLICVRERHRPGLEPVNEVVAVATDGSGPPLPLVGGHDFFAAPRLSADGRRLAWLCWDHPRMPWDGTELWTAELVESGQRGQGGPPGQSESGSEIALGPATRVVGGPDESIIQPKWGDDGALYFCSDRTEWWNLYRAEGDGASVEALTTLEAEVGGPPWLFGDSHWCFVGQGTGRTAFVVRSEGFDRLMVLDRATGESRTLPAPHRAISDLRPYRDGVAYLGASPTEEPAVIALAALDGEPEVVRRSRGCSFDPSLVSVPTPIHFPTTDGATAHALFYAPRNPEAEGLVGERPPLLVMSHGGPTSAARAKLDLGVQFWTSRGLAVVDVNYRGSTGYGRPFRDALKGRWGQADVDDCIAAARWLADAGEVDGTRMAIRGGSAGGYTTLCALAFHDVFAAGASYYGVADAEALARDTHKFESRYLDSLIGPYPETAARYRERSPIYHLDRLSCPVLVLQGLEDQVVPPSQAEMMVEALRRKGIPFAYLAFEGEQHGFRKAETVQRALEAELSFFGRVFGFRPADDLAEIEIENAGALAPAPATHRHE